MKIINICDHTLVVDRMQGGVVLDCGLNRGEFSKNMVKRFGARVIGVEPDPELFPKLPKLNNTVFIEKALSGENGKAQLNLRGGEDSSLVFAEEATSTQTVECVTLDSLTDSFDLQNISLLKLDIEGAELDVIKKTKPETLAKFEQITVEFHDFIQPETEPQVRDAIQKIEASGFITLKFSTYTHGDILFLNKTYFSVNSFDRMIMMLKGRIIPGALRKLKRIGKS